MNSFIRMLLKQSTTKFYLSRNEAKMRPTVNAVCYLWNILFVAPRFISCYPDFENTL